MVKNTKIMVKTTFCWDNFNFRIQSTKLPLYSVAPNSLWAAQEVEGVDIQSAVKFFKKLSLCLFIYFILNWAVLFATFHGFTAQLLPHITVFESKHKPIDQKSIDKLSILSFCLIVAKLSA